MRQRLPLPIALLLFLFCTSARADVTLPRIFGSHMVLQRDVPIPVWGTADAGETVTVTAGDKPPIKTTAGPDGKWMAKLPAMPAGGPITVTIRGKNEIVLEDVLIGEVWLCSGQSNMEWVVGGCQNAEQEIAAADFPMIRHFKVEKKPEGFPATDVPSAKQWEVCSPQTVGAFTACGYFMARHLHKELGVPIGLINSSWGGTLIEPWTPPVGFEMTAELKGLLERVRLADPKSAEHKAKLGEYLQLVEAWLAQAREALPAEKPLPALAPYPSELKPMTDQVASNQHQQPTALYNGMIHGLIPFAFRGAIWYQGESNHREGMLYAAKMEALVGGWRKLWGRDFPFLYVQIAPYRYGDEPPQYLPEFWEAQAAALKIPGTGMVVPNDIGDFSNIHPKNKQEVGRRLALLALKRTYGRADLVAEGPTFKKLDIERDRLRVEFDNVGGGLTSRDGKPLNWFKIIGEDTDFEDAEAAIEGSAVILRSPKVPKPVAVQFAWHKAAEPNLQNKEGLPARPFRAGNVPKRDLLALRIAESKDYTLALELDLSKLAHDIAYDTDNRPRIARPFDRIAYFLELQQEGKPVQYLYVSMDAFTDDLAKIGIPAPATKALFQQKVSNANVESNVDGIIAGSGLAGCNIEFWPHNYGPQNSAGIPNASAELWDFGDQYSPPEDGYGCMQVHNFEAKQTLFSINNWKSGPAADIGIGNSGPTNERTGITRDWTFNGNAGTYIIKRLRVLVREKK